MCVHIVYFSVEGIKARWESLKKLYMKDHKEKLKYRPSGSEAMEEKNNFYYYDSMMYLDRHVRHNKYVYINIFLNHIIFYLCRKKCLLNYLHIIIYFILILL